MSNIQQSINQAISLGGLLFSQSGLPEQLKAARAGKLKEKNLTAQLEQAILPSERTRITRELTALRQQQFETNPTAATSSALSVAKAQEQVAAYREQQFEARRAERALKRSAAGKTGATNQESPVRQFYSQIDADIAAGDASIDALEAVRARMKSSRYFRTAIAMPTTPTSEQTKKEGE